MKRTVKFLDLKTQIPQFKDEILAGFNQIIDEAEFVSGRFVAAFEKSFAAHLGADHCLVVNSGTTALQLTLTACGVGPGDEVVVPVNTFIATAEAVSMIGGTPAFVDVEPETGLIDVKAVERAIGPRTKAVIPVHLFGQCADMDPLCELAAARGISVVEDAAQSHGASYKGRQSGTLGDAAAFSFYPSKNLGSWGEGGAITTNDAGLDEKLRLIRDHGSSRKYQHVVIGGNFRCNEFQGVVLGTKLQYLSRWNAQRQHNAARYQQQLAGNDRVKLPVVAPFNDCVWHLFVIRTERRDRLREYLAERGIETAVHYPVPLHLSGAYRHLGHRKGEFPVAEKLQSEIVSLPIHPALQPEEIQYVADTINTGSW